MFKRFTNYVRNKYDVLINRSKPFDTESLVSDKSSDNETSKPFHIDSNERSFVSSSKDIEIIPVSVSEDLGRLPKHSESISNVSNSSVNEIPAVKDGRKKPRSQKQILSFKRNFAKHLQPKPKVTKKKVLDYDKIFNSK